MRFSFVALILVSSCSDETAAMPDGAVADAALPDAAAPADAAPPDAPCPVTLEISPANPVAPTTIDAQLVFGPCFGAPVVHWTVTLPDGSTIHGGMSLEFSFTAATPGTYTVEADYLPENRILGSKSAQVVVGSSASDAGL